MPSYTKEPVIIVSGFIKRENKYLLVFDPRFCFWRVPGGRLKFGETVEEALKREMKEELNVEVEIIRFLGFGQDIVKLIEKSLKVSRVLLYFECKIKKGELKPNSEEIKEIKWLSLDGIKKHENIEPGILDFFRRFSSITSFHNQP